MFCKTTVLKKIKASSLREFYLYLSGSYSEEKKKQRKKEFKDQFKNDPDVIGALWKINKYLALGFSSKANPFFDNLEIIMTLLSYSENIKYVPAKWRKKEEVMVKYWNKCMSEGVRGDKVSPLIAKYSPHLLETAKWKKYVKNWEKNRPIPINQ